MIINSETIKLTVVGSILTVILGILVFLLFDQPKPTTLKVPVDKIVDSKTYTQIEYLRDDKGDIIKDENGTKTIVKKEDLIVYTYQSDEVDPFLPNEVPEQRTPNTVTIALGDNKFVAKSGHFSAQVDGEWKKIKSATTTKEIFNEEISRSKNFLARFIDTALAASTGFTLAGTGSSQGGGNQAWTSPENITASDSIEASCLDLGTGDDTDYLQGTNFGFAIPDGSTIDGIETKQKVRANGSVDMEIFYLRIVVGGVVAGTIKNPATGLTSVSTEYTHGASNDLWGLTPSVAQINASDFGFRVLYEDCCSGSGDDTWVDAFWMNIYYTAPVIVESKIKIDSGKIKIDSGKIKID